MRDEDLEARLEARQRRLLEALQMMADEGLFRLGDGRDEHELKMVTHFTTVVEGIMADGDQGFLLATAPDDRVMHTAAHAKFLSSVTARMCTDAYFTEDDDG